MASKKCIAVVGKSDRLQRLLGQCGEGRVHGGWTSARNMLGEIRALKETGSEDLYGAIVVDVEDWRAAEVMGERIHDGLADLKIAIPVIVLDDRRLIEKKQKVTMAPRNAHEIAAVMRAHNVI